MPFKKFLLVDIIITFMSCFNTYLRAKLAKIIATSKVLQLKNVQSGLFFVFPCQQAQKN
jgi:hypothetical protein